MCGRMSSDDKPRDEGENRGISGKGYMVGLSGKKKKNSGPERDSGFDLRSLY